MADRMTERQCTRCGYRTDAEGSRKQIRERKMIHGSNQCVSVIMQGTTPSESTRDE